LRSFRNEEQHAKKLREMGRKVAELFEGAVAEHIEVGRRRGDGLRARSSLNHILTR
jgi:hypothetical protein